MSSDVLSLSAELPEIRPSPPLPLPSRFGRYRLTHLLAVGGMAQIYLAKSFGAEGFVKALVIKRLDPKLALNAFFTELFINEAKLLVTLSHGNIVPVFDFGRVEGDLYMAMEYIHGASLGRLLRLLEQQQHPLGLHLSAYIAMEVCKGLDYAHRKTDTRGRPAGIIHRDIKPNNILISLEGEVKIVDFGVAKLAGRLEQKQRLAGTVAYMSPEQANQQPVDARTDVFSSGLVLHEMLSRRRVYEGESFEQTLELAQRGRVPELPAQVPRELRVVVERACAKHPEGRYGAAHAMEQDLSTFLLLHRSAGEALEARSPSSQLAQLMRQIPQQELEEPEEGEPEPSAGAMVPVPAGQTQPDLPSSISSQADEPDLALIRGAAETFHSEFFTRVLQEELVEGRWSWLRRPRILVAMAALLLVPLAALLFVRAQDRPQSDPPSGEQGPEAARSSTIAQPGPTQTPGAGVGSADAGATPPRIDATREGSLGDGGPADAGIVTAAVDARPRRGRRRRAVARFGYLNLNAIPWANVTIDGRRLPRTTPLLKLRLEPGVHRVELHNPQQRLKRVLKVRIRAGATTWKVVRLRR